MNKIYCQKCLQRTNHKVLFKKELGSHPSDEFGWSQLYETIECCGCNNIQFREVYSDITMVNYSYDDNEEYQYNKEICYPLYLENHQELNKTYCLPYKIRAIYSETIETLKIKSNILAGVGFRAIIESICIDKNIKGRNLQFKINNLLKEKLITEKEANRLHSIRFLGNDSIHEMLAPDFDKLIVVLDIVENLLNNLYLIDENAKDVLETMIVAYSRFEELIWARSNKLADDEETTIKKLLGKDIRRIEISKLEIFTNELIEKIESGKIDWLKIKVKETGNNIADKQKFYILK